MSSKDDLLILPWEEQEQTSDIRENFPIREADRNRTFAKHRRSSILKIPLNSENSTERVALQVNSMSFLVGALAVFTIYLLA
jgi:hypothetical protein